MLKIIRIKPESTDKFITGTATVYKGGEPVFSFEIKEKNEPGKKLNVGSHDGISKHLQVFIGKKRLLFGKDIIVNPKHARMAARRLPAEFDVKIEYSKPEDDREIEAPDMPGTEGNENSRDNE